MLNSPFTQRNITQCLLYYQAVLETNEKKRRAVLIKGVEITVWEFEKPGKGLQRTGRKDCPLGKPGIEKGSGETPEEARRQGTQYCAVRAVGKRLAVQRGEWWKHRAAGLMRRAAPGRYEEEQGQWGYW